jgi:type VI secretion system secreted protein VgrG
MVPALDGSGLGAEGVAEGLAEGVAGWAAALFPHVGGTLGPHTQATRLLRLHTPLGPDQLLAERAWITEAIGPDDGRGPAAGLRLRLHALAADAHLELKRLVGQPVLLQLLPQHSRTALRPWHGHVSEAALLGSDGGLARYELIVEPWLAWLGHRRDSRVFQGLSVPEIVDAVFGGYESQGRLQPAWRWDLADAAIYQRRSLCIQYQETDLGFVQRLLREEGLVCWWMHAGDPASPALGVHTLVIADHAGAVPASRHTPVRYTQSGQALPEDALTRWTRQRQVQAASVSLASRDDRSRSLRPAAQAGPALRLPALGQHEIGRAHV